MRHHHHFFQRLRNAYGVILLLILCSFLMGMRENPVNLQDIQIWESYVVREGDTLWSLAARANIDEQPRVILRQIRAYNQLESTTIVPGQVVFLPSEHL